MVVPPPPPGKRRLDETGSGSSGGLRAPDGGSGKADGGGGGNGVVGITAVGLEPIGRVSGALEDEGSLAGGEVDGADGRGGGRIEPTVGGGGGGWPAAAAAAAAALKLAIAAEFFSIDDRYG